ncbi:MAG: AzlD domain-containing protein [bacterium]|nr:AzlD domain-containing protein [bacterium]
MSDGAVWALIVAMGALTYALRASFILLQDRVRLPALVRRGLVYVPAAVLAAIAAPAFVQLGGDVDVATQAPRWAAGVVGVLVALKTQHIVAVLVAGMLTLWGVRALIG